MHDEQSDSFAGGACGGTCARRVFLRNGATLMASLLAVGLTAERAIAMPVGFMDALRVTKETARYPVPGRDGVTIDNDREVILVRSGGAAYAFALSCPHQNTALRWNADEGEFQCSKHHSKYRPDGAFISGRATRAMDRFALHREGAVLVVEFDRLIQRDIDPAGWAAACVTL
jgi:nitrite reductase/ring-hydroxylating ferredoxin subunit